jgi:hypothetical protein
MTKLNDLQLILLTGAAQRDNGSLLPAPKSVADAGDRLQDAFTSLLKIGLIEEGPKKNAKATWRADGDDRVGLFITDAGRSAINVEPGGSDGETKDVAATPAAAPANPERQTKGAAVVAMLERPAGATLAEMVAATGWLPHTTRAALTGLRKKGFEIEKHKRGEETCYRIIAKA